MVNRDEGVNKSKRRRPTVSEVAREAGVSVATVSRVLNNSRYVSDDTRETVIAAMRKLNYYINLPARTLKTRKTGRIGVIVPDIGNPFWASVVKGIEHEVVQQGYHVLLCNTDETPSLEAAYIRMMRETWVDGVIIATSGGNDDLIYECGKDGPPVVLMDRRLDMPDVPADMVALDNLGGIYRAVRYLHDLGHRRIGMITDPVSITPGRERLDGYRKAMEALGLPKDESLVAEGNFKRDSGYELARRFLALDRRPTAIVVANNVMATGAIKAIREVGLRIPEDVSVISFDDTVFAEIVHPPLTVVAPPSNEMGLTAGRLITERLASRVVPISYREVILKPSFIERQSCSPPGCDSTCRSE